MSTVNDFEPDLGDMPYSWRHARNCSVGLGLSACTCGLSEWRNWYDSVGQERDAEEPDPGAPWNIAGVDR